MMLMLGKFMEKGVGLCAEFLGRILADRRVVGGLLLVAQLVIVMYSVGWMSGRWLWAPRY